MIWIDRKIKPPVKIGGFFVCIRCGVAAKFRCVELIKKPFKKKARIL